jgi:hypothetical protein
MEINRTSSYHKPVRAVVAVSAEYGVEALVVTRKPVNSKIFLKIFPQLNRRGKNYRVLLDGAS